MGSYMHLVYEKQHAPVFYWNVLLGWQTRWLCPTPKLAHFIDSVLVCHSSHLGCLITTLRILSKLSRTLTVFFWAMFFIYLRHACLPHSLRCIPPNSGPSHHLLSRLSHPIAFPKLTNSSLESYFQWHLQ